MLCAASKSIYLPCLTSLFFFFFLLLCSLVQFKFIQAHYKKYSLYHLPSSILRYMVPPLPSVFIKLLYLYICTDRYVFIDQNSGALARIHHHIYTIGLNHLLYFYVIQMVKHVGVRLCIRFRHPLFMVQPILA